jgi:molybdenum cofactor cytidylyltransferase
MVEGVILAAGLSTRSGRWKMALPLGNKTVLQRCVEAMLNAVDRIWVVTGWQAERVPSLLQGYPKVNLVPNPDYRRGMFSSVQVGLARVHAERVFLTPGDYALIPSSVYAKMLDVPGEIVIPTHAGKRGHPVLLGRASIREILALHSNATLRDYIAASGFVTVEVGAPGIHLDVDTPEDYAAVRRLTQGRSRST